MNEWRYIITTEEIAKITDQWTADPSHASIGGIILDAIPNDGEEYERGKAERDAFWKAEITDLCRAIIRTDKTPRYSYDGSENNDGEKAIPGTRWLTPYEIAENQLSLIRPEKRELSASGEEEGVLKAMNENECKENCVWRQGTGKNPPSFSHEAMKQCYNCGIDRGKAEMLERIRSLIDVGVLDVEAEMFVYQAFPELSASGEEEGGLKAMDEKPERELDMGIFYDGYAQGKAEMLERIRKLCEEHEELSDDGSYVAMLISFDSDDVRRAFPELPCPSDSQARKE